MHTFIERVVKIPSDVSVVVEGDDVKGYLIKAKGPLGENSRVLKFREIYIEKFNNLIKIYSNNTKRRYRAMIGTFAGHLENLIKGVKDGFEYRLKIVYSHFPIKVKVEKDEVIIENFLGETVPRKAKIVGKTKVEVKGQEVIVKSVDIEDAGQTAANIEKATKIKRKDPRVFQDGIYIVKKPW
ncbi:MAG: 50S ribosomal protein L6 [Archaeoglobaceae archaeon]|nr:50S ribosomal protein L6 [Archaeoglobaceae archaeon]MCX8151449.1 50S ribosomal protein L6 [Archaeoglobaceae archaeon]MDW8014211.1 50S ribosomal protein L6 [Archaeoglobaceae archaeon]